MPKFHPGSCIKIMLFKKLSSLIFISPNSLFLSVTTLALKSFRFSLLAIFHMKFTSNIKARLEAVCQSNTSVVMMEKSGPVISEVLWKLNTR
jgi:hypothetical protein